MLRRRATWFPGASLPPCQGQSSGSASLWSNRRHSSVSHSGPKSWNSYCRKVEIYKTWVSPLPHVPCWVPGRSSSGDPTLLRSSHCGRAGTRNHTCNNCNMHNWTPKRTIYILFWRIFCITRPWSNKNMFTIIFSPEFSLVLLILDPEAFWLESFPIKENEVALPVLLRPVAQGGDHDVAIRETVGGVGGAHSKGVHLPRLNDLREFWSTLGEWMDGISCKKAKTAKEWQSSHLVQLWVERVWLDVNNVDSVRSQGRNDEPASWSFRKL